MKSKGEKQKCFSEILPDTSLNCLDSSLGVKCRQDTHLDEKLETKSTKTWSKHLTQQKNYCSQFMFLLLNAKQSVKYLLVVDHCIGQAPQLGNVSLPCLCYLCLMVEQGSPLQIILKYFTLFSFVLQVSQKTTLGKFECCRCKL